MLPQLATSTRGPIICQASCPLAPSSVAETLAPTKRKLHCSNIRATLQYQPAKALAVDAQQVLTMSGQAALAVQDGSVATQTPQETWMDIMAYVQKSRAFPDCKHAV